MIDCNIENIREAIASHRICVLVPTYNNAGTLRSVMSDIIRYSPNVIVVNDGSTDATQSILDGFGDKVDIVSYHENKGKGYALRQGFERAMAMGYDYAITIDSDGQHYASDIPHFVKAIIEYPGALILGERNLTNVDINGKSTFANKFSNFWFAVQTGKKLNDTQTGYRAYPLKNLRGLSLLTSRYEAELELLVLACWHGTTIIPIPIQVYYPPRAERVSHFKPALDFTRISVLNTILCIAALVYGIPFRLWNAVAGKRIFKGEFKLFTRKNGEKKEAATTLGRLSRSIYGITYFTFWSIGVFTPLIWAFFSFGKASEERKLKLHKMLQWVSTFLTRRFPGANVRYENPNEEKFDRPAIIICNHQSHLDLPVLMSIHPKMIFLTNDWVWNNMFYGRIIHQAEFLPVSAGMDVIMPHLKDLKDRGYSIVVFPEGTRSADCSILRFHQGAFHLAKELELDIVPMVLHGAGHYLPKTDFMFRKGTITLRIMERMPYRPGDFEILRRQSSKYRKMIKNEYDIIAGRNEKSDYFKSLVLYKYAYRSWRIVSRCKYVLKRLPYSSSYIDNEQSGVRAVRIMNSGIGVFPLIYAMVNKDVEVYSFEENLDDYIVASDTSGLPSNLHLKHPVWASDYDVPGVDFDKTFILGSITSHKAYPLYKFDSPTVIRLNL